MDLILSESIACEIPRSGGFWQTLTCALGLPTEAIIDSMIGFRMYWSLSVVLGDDEDIQGTDSSRSGSEKCAVFSIHPDSISRPQSSRSSTS